MKNNRFDPRVDAYIEKAAPFARPVLIHLRKLMHQACPTLTESIKWRMPFFLEQGIVLANMAAFKQHCSFGFWGPEMKTVLAEDGLDSGNARGSLDRITDLGSLPSDKTLLAHMRLAAELVDSGQRTKSIDRSSKKRRPVTPIPRELAAGLSGNQIALKTFEKFSASSRGEYAEWISEAKRARTKKQRVEQAVEWIAQGKTRYWKYQR